MNGESCNEQCWKEGIIYAANCTKCYEDQINTGLEPVNRTYIGESSRTLYTRVNQHINDYRKAGQRLGMDPEDDKVSSWMWDHAQSHGGIQNLETDYNFGVVCSYRDPFTRQVSEATRIQKAINNGVHYDTGGREVKIISLNRKGEYFSPIERWNKD